MRHLPAANGTVAMEVVGTGTSDGISRRVEVMAQSNLEGSVFGSNSVVGDDFISMNSNARVEGNTATNGDLTLQSNAVLCGNAQVGTEPGDLFTLTSNAKPWRTELRGHHLSTARPRPTPPSQPVFQGDVPTVNSNGRFFSPGPAQRWQQRHLVAARPER